MSTRDKRRRVTYREFPASDVDTQMRLTHLQERFTAQHAGEKGIDLGEGIADLSGPQVGGRQPCFGDDLGVLTQSDIEMETGRVEDPPPLLACAMRLDEEPLAGEGEVGDEILFGVLAGLLQDIQLLRQLQREVLAQLHVQDQRIDVVCHDRHTTSTHTNACHSARGV